MPRLAAGVSAVVLAALPLAAPAAFMTSVPASARAPAVAVYVAKPRGDGPFPAVLLLHGCGGFNAYGAYVADRFSARGYVGVALDALGPNEPDGACTNPAGAGTEAAAARATLAWLRTQKYVEPDKLGVVGFSMGGIALLDLIDSRDAKAEPPAGLRAAVAYYPACEDRGSAIAVPLAIFDGDADTVTPSAPCAALVKAATAAGKTAQITTYPGATHGFNVPGPDRDFFGQPIRFDASAAEDSAKATALFLDRYLK